MEQREAPIEEEVDVDPQIVVNVNTLLAAAADPVAPEPINLLAAAAAYLDPEVFQRAREGTRPGDLISDSDDEEEEMEVDILKGRVERSTDIQNDSSEDSTSESSSESTSESTSDSNDAAVSSGEEHQEVEGGVHKNIYQLAYHRTRCLPANYAALRTNARQSTSSSEEESHEYRVSGPAPVSAPAMQAIKAKERYRHPTYNRGNEITSSETTNEVPQLSCQAILLLQEVPQPSTSRSALAQEQSEVACSSGSSKLAKKIPAVASRKSQRTRKPVLPIPTPKTPRKKKKLTAKDISKLKKLHDATVQSLSNQSTTPASGTVFIDIDDMVADLNIGPLEPPHNLDLNLEFTEAFHSVCPSIAVDKEDKNDHVDEKNK